VRSVSGRPHLCSEVLPPPAFGAPATWRDHGVMELDRRPGKVFDVILQAAFRRSQASADEAQALLDGGFPEPAYVWAFRSVEIYVKEVMLLPLFLEEVPEGAWDDVWAEAWRRIGEVFKNGRWTAALAKVDEVYGPLELMGTEDGRDVWRVWKSEVVRRRGDIVHGRPLAEQVTREEAVTVLLWANQMRGQLVMRLVVAGKHPIHDLVVETFKRAKVAYEAGKNGESP
jgi:hypothetical protein